MDGYEKRGEFPRELVRKAGDAGLYGAVFPESLGGTNLGYVAATVIQEEMARNDVRFAACNNQQGSTCPSCIYFGGTPEQIKQHVPDLLATRRTSPAWGARGCPCRSWSCRARRRAIVVPGGGLGRAAGAAQVRDDGRLAGPLLERPSRPWRA